MFGIGPMELVLILVVALLVFGPKRLPELARTLGRGMGEFRRASNDLRQSLALDDLQKDLRDGLTSDNSIQRPAQAGDSLPDAKKAEESAAKAENDNDANAEPASHPSELPLDNDYEHNDVSTEPESADAPPVETPSSPSSPSTPSTPSSPLAPAPTLGDSELGNIPVRRPAVGGRKPDSERG